MGAKAAPVTALQRKVLVWMRAYYRCNEFMPSFQEISDHFGWRSPNAARMHVNALVKKGYINRTENKARAFTFTEAK